MTTSYIDSELFSLADETISALATPKRGLVGQPNIFKAAGGNARKAANTVYKNMRQATRFVLEDELTEYVARLSAQIRHAQRLCRSIIQHHTVSHSRH